MVYQKYLQLVLWQCGEDGGDPGHVHPHLEAGAGAARVRHRHQPHSDQRQARDSRKVSGN